MPPLGKLPLLKSLTIKFSYGLKKAGVEFLGIESKNKKDDILFPNFKTLLFVNLGEWEEWIGIGEMKAAEEHWRSTIMPWLQVLRISNCPKLKSLLDFLCTTPLKDLEIDRSPILSQSCQRGIGEDWLKISHIPNIQIDFEHV
uniref:Disease resistance protein n=1 Tax=Quercus lobata TaxID=97700 RepID=A0A7N2L4S4_QUELO